MQEVENYHRWFSKKHCRHLIQKNEGKERKRIKGYNG